MERYGKPVGLIPHPLQEVQTFARARKDHRELLARDPDLLKTLGQPDQGDVIDPQLHQRCPGGVDLGKATVDDNKARWVGEPSRSAGVEIDRHALDIASLDPVVEIALESAGKHLVHGRRVVDLRVGVPARTQGGLDDEPSVLGFAWQPILEDHHGGHHVGALHVTDVEALDPVSYTHLTLPTIYSV